MYPKQQTTFRMIAELDPCWRDRYVGFDESLLSVRPSRMQQPKLRWLVALCRNPSHLGNF